LQKPRSPLETYHDLDGNVVNFFRVLRDQPDELIRKIRLTPWAREEYELSLEPCDEPTERARRFYSMLWMSMQGGTHDSAKGTWRVKRNARETDGAVRWFQCPEEFIAVADELEIISGRLRYVQIEHIDALDSIRKYDTSQETLIYFDPPYVSETRSNSDRYVHEWTEDSHLEAAALLRQCSGYVIVSGYACPLYADLYESHGWIRRDKEAQTNSGGKRIESIWLSPRTWQALQVGAGLPLFGSGL
jgi:DNA adenine methylase